jgi:hypothetical protein
MERCAKKVVDKAGIVREAIFQQRLAYMWQTTVSCSMQQEFNRCSATTAELQ